jgi:hypothetical protein
LVFQDFFIDLDLPLSLTVGDEIAVPVGVFNYLTEEQSVRLEVQPENWFELLDEPVQEITIPANDITVVYFRIRALDFGSQPFQVTAIGSKLSDAIRKEVRVYPDGQPILLGCANRRPNSQPGSPHPGRSHRWDAETDRQDFSRHGRPGGGRSGGHPAHAERLL